MAECRFQLCFLVMFKRAWDFYLRELGLEGEIVFTHVNVSLMGSLYSRDQQNYPLPEIFVEEWYILIPLY